MQKRIAVPLMLAVLFAVLLPFQAFAADLQAGATAQSIRSGWYALDGDRNPVSGKTYFLNAGETTKKPVVYIRNDKQTFTRENFNVSYLYSADAKTGYALISGKNQLKDAFVCKFNMAPAQTSTTTSAAQQKTFQISLSGTKFTYTGSAIKPKATVKDGSTTLKEGAGYKLSYSKNINAGTATVKAEGLGEYAGCSKSATFSITPQPLTKKIVGTIASKKGNGKAQTPTLNISYAGKKLRYQTDYTVTYKNSKGKTIAASALKNPDSYQVIVTGKGNFSGSVAQTFKITDAMKLVLDKTTMMIDNEHYDRCKLTVSFKDNCGYSAKDLVWKINCNKSYKNAASFSEKKSQLTLKGKKSVMIYGKLWSGNDPITVTVSIGKNKTAKCNLKVISCGMADSDVNNIPGGNTHKEKFEKAVNNDPIYWEGKKFYLTEPASKRDGNYLKTKSYGEKYVAAYINNAQWLVRTYRTKARYKSEYAAKTYTCSIQKGLKIKWNKKKNKMEVTPQSTSHNFTTKKLTKKKGELSASGYLFFCSNKNQWEYLLKKDKNDVWHCVASKRCSTAHSNHAFGINWCMRVIGWNGNGMGLVASHYPNENGYSYVGGAGNFMHLQNNSHIGTPGTEGCTMVGKFTDKIYYQIMHDAGLGTRVIIY